VAGDSKVSDDSADLEQLVRTLLGRVEELTDEVAVLRAAGAGPTPSPVIAPAPEASPPTVPTGRTAPVATVESSSSTESPTADGPETTTRISRRGALALGAAAAVGIGAVADSVLSATPAGATTGNMQYGASNNAGTAETDLTSSATTETLSVVNTGTGEGIDVQSQGAAAIKATSNGIQPAVYALSPSSNGVHGVYVEVYGRGCAFAGNVYNAVNTLPAAYATHLGLGAGVEGWADNTDSSAAGVYGRASGTGPGVQGQSTSGYGLSGQGGLAPLYLDPADTPGAPTAGTHALGELYVDSNGAVWSCQSAGDPGTWVLVLVGGATNPVGTAETILSSSPNGPALTVQNLGSGANATSLLGTDGGIGTGVGVRGELDNEANTSAAVAGITNGTGAALAGTCLGAGYGAVVSGGLAPILLVPAATAGPPTTGTHALGELYVDVDGVQYRCVASGTPGTWVPQYSVVPLPAPVRVIATPTSIGGITGPLVPGSTVHTSSVLTGANGIPEGAVGVVANLAVSGVGGAVLNGFGVLTIFPAGEATPATANINAGAGCYALSNTVTVAFGTGADAGKVSIVWNGGGPVPDAEAYLDVTAYLL
jgi:hypothetical protein